jgi:hypothetical protein
MSRSLTFTNNAPTASHEVWKGDVDALNFSLLQTLSPGVAGFTDSAGVAADSYAVRSIGAGDPSAFVIKPGAPVPAAPSGLGWDILAPATGSIFWTDNSTDETGFRIEQRQDGGSWTTLGTIGPDNGYYAAAYTIQVARRVFAVNASGDSTASGVIYSAPVDPTVGSDDLVDEGGGLASLMVAHPAHSGAGWVDTFEVQINADGAGFNTVENVANDGSGPIIFSHGQSSGTSIVARCRAIKDGHPSGWSGETDAVLLA